MTTQPSDWARPEFTVDEALRIADQNADAYDKVASVSRTLAAEVRRLAALSRPQDGWRKVVMAELTRWMCPRDAETAYTRLTEALATPTAGQGGDEYPECSGDPASCPENEGHGCCKPNPKCSCPSGDGSLDWPCKTHPAPAAPVSERARELLAQQYDADDPDYTEAIRGGDPLEDDDERALRALEQALTQQRGECEAVAWQVEWIDNAGDPTRYIAYCEEDADDKLGVLSDGEAATAKVIPLYTTPQPGAEGLRDE